MKSRALGWLGRFLLVLLTLVTMLGPSAAVLAQTNAAAQAVRERVDDVAQAQPQDTPPRPGGRYNRNNPYFPRTDEPETPPAAAEAATAIPGAVDTTYVPSTAMAVVVLRPAALMASPIGQAFPVELVTAYGLKFTGFDPAKVDEVVAFAELSGEEPGMGLVAKFNEPYKGSAIPVSLRGAAKVGRLGDRSYLQAQGPAGHSFYGPDTKTLVVARDAMLRRMVESKDQPKSGPLMERLNAAPTDANAYVAVDVASLAPMMPMLQMFVQQAPPEAKKILDAVPQVAAAEILVNMSNANPVTIVVHATDESAAANLESLAQELIQMQKTRAESSPTAPPAGDQLMHQAMMKYSARTADQWIPMREGTKLTFLQSGSPTQEQQLANAAMLGFAFGRMIAGAEAAQNSIDAFPTPENTFPAEAAARRPLGPPSPVDPPTPRRPPR